MIPAASAATISTLQHQRNKSTGKTKVLYAMGGYVCINFILYALYYGGRKLTF
jgi:hypothetical protein